MKLEFTVPATVVMTIEVDAKTKDEAIRKFNEGEFEIVNEDVYDWDTYDIEEFEVV